SAAHQIPENLYWGEVTWTKVFAFSGSSAPNAARAFMPITASCVMPASNFCVRTATSAFCLTRRRGWTRASGRRHRSPNQHKCTSHREGCSMQIAKLAFAAAAFLFAASGAGEAVAQSWADIVAAAEKEGSVSVIAPPIA